MRAASLGFEQVCVGPVMFSISIIIPTKDRVVSLRRVLTRLVEQTLPVSDIEVFLVDDSLGDETRRLASGTVFPFSLRYIRGTGSGAVGARNLGVFQASGEIVILLDDDILIERQCISEMVDELRQHPQAIVLGNLLPYQRVDKMDATPFRTIYSEMSVAKSQFVPGKQLDFTACLTGLLAMYRKHYWAAGGMRPLDSRGDSRGAWTDVIFGYHASAIGLEIRRCPNAIAQHDDRATVDLKTQCQVMWRGAYEASCLFAAYPHLQPCIPMFHDKTPLAWGKDSIGLVLRKSARRVASSQPAIQGMEKLARFLENCYPVRFLLRPLYRWIIGGYVFQGYQRGLKAQTCLGHKEGSRNDS